MGTPILARAALEIGASGDDPGATYCLLVPYGVYVGEIAAATGITAATADNTYEDDVLSSIKQLVRADVLMTTKVLVYDAVANVSHVKTLHYSPDKTTFKTDIKGKLWPVGLGAGQPITGTSTATRVRSKQ